jgi:hypothetical protein
MVLQAVVLTAACAAEGTAVPPAPPQQTSHPCQGLTQVTVLSETPADAAAVCDGARRALEFLARAGLESPPSTTIEIVPELPGELAGRAVGCYVREDRRILLLDFDAFRSGGGWFQMPPTLELYRAAATHEMAHAVIGCHSEPRRLAVAAHEYIAYVVMFATLDPALRSALLARFPGAGFGSTAQINDINHIVNPNQFGVDAWRHYQRVKHREPWLRKVIAGDAVPDIAEDPGADSR